MERSKLTPERWEQIEKLYHTALEKEAGLRSAFLDEACAGDDSLRREVESLLAYANRAENFIESPAIEMAATMLAKEQAGSAIGMKAGPFEILSLLGAGGMGEVYLAEDTRLGRKVALKLLPKELTQDGERVRRFEQEARTVSALNHPNILTIYDIGRVEDIRYLATEYIQGQTLRQEMAASRLELRNALDIGCQVASALSAAHEAGIVHRDIKPENIMLRRDGYVKVLDFGLAKLAKPRGVFHSADAPAGVSTEVGIVLGTVNYMSPEQARGQSLDVRSDIFSFGVVLYEMIAGRLPFAGATSADVIASILEREPPALPQRAAPEALEWIISKALRKERDERYQTAMELLSDLKGLQRRLEFQEELERSKDGDQTTVVMSSNVEYDSSGADSAARKSRNPIDSLAILPLTNTTADPSMEYFSDGITETIIDTLSRLPDLRVMAWSTVSNYRNQQIDPREIGKSLRVRAVLTGRVVQLDDRLVIKTELVDATDGSRLWGENYRCRPSDVMEVEAEISREISEKLLVRLTTEERRRLAKRYTENTEAYHAYLKGRYFWNKRTVESLRRGIEYFKEAIDQDPSFASAYAGLSDSYTLLVVREALPPDEGFSKAKAAAKRALSIDNDLAEAHASLGHAMLHNWEWDDGEQELKRAIELNPGYPSAHHWYSEHLTATGRCGESIRELKLAAELDPLSLIINADLGRAYYYARDYDEVTKQEARTLEMDSQFWLSYINLGRSYTQRGMHAQAIAELEKASELSPANTEVLSFLAFAYAAAGKRDAALNKLGELNEQAKHGYVPPYHYAIVNAGLGDADRALEWLERAVEKHAVDLFTLKVEPMFDCLRSDPRFTDLLERVGLSSGGQVSGDSTHAGIHSKKQTIPTAIAVLPFKPINAQGRDEYLELGIADALITRLSDINQIVVRPTSSVRKYTALEQDSVTAGRELAVDSVLEGSIQKLNDRIRVTARLVKVSDGRSLWTGKFDESSTDIFAVEDSISERVAAALALKLTGDERERLHKRHTENTDAYHLYWKGRYYWNRRSEEALQKAVECFDQAIEIDRNYALAYGGLADCYTKLGDVGVTAVPPRESFARARRAALKALQIDSSLVEVHASLGHLEMHHLQWTAAEKHFKTAIELNPNYASAHQWYSHFMAFHKRFDEALERIEVARRLDPLSLPIIDSVGEFLYFARRNEEAIVEFHKALEMDPNFLPSCINLGLAYEQVGMFSEAEAHFIKARQITGESVDALAALGHTYAISARTDDAFRVLAQLTELATHRYVSPYDIALIHAALSETDEAFRWLEKAYDERVEWMIYTNVDPRLDPLRTDAKFNDLIRRLGFAP